MKGGDAAGENGTTGLRASWRDEAAAMFRLATPIVLGQLAWVAMLTTDAAMIGRLGKNPLAGAALVLMVYFMLYVFAFGITMATAALAAQAYGARNPRYVRRVIRQGLWVTVFLSAPMLALMSLAEPILNLLGQPAEAVVHADAYMSTLMWSLPFATAFCVLRNFVSALNRPVWALWVLLGCVPLNALLDYALIFGNFGMPRLELTGAGIATTSVNFLMFAALLTITLTARPFRRYTILGRFWRPDWATFRQIFTLGTPIAGIMMLEAGFFIGAVFMMGWIGTVAVAAHMIAIQIPHVTFMVPMGLSQAATVRVGHAVGRRDALGAYRAGWTAIALALVFMAIMSGVIVAMPESLASLFLDETRADTPEVLALAVTFLGMAALFQAADGVQAVAAGALRGLNDTGVPMAIAGVSYWVIGLASCVVLAFWMDLGGIGLWIGFVVGLAIAAVLLTWRFARLGKRRHIPFAPGEAH